MSHRHNILTQQTTDSLREEERKIERERDSEKYSNESCNQLNPTEEFSSRVSVLLLISFISVKETNCSRDALNKVRLRFIVWRRTQREMTNTEWIPDVQPLSAARLLVLSARLADEESFEEEELQVPGGDDEEAEGRRPPGDVLRVGQKQEVVGALTHAAEVVEAEHVEDGFLHFESRILQQHNKYKYNKPHCCYYQYKVLLLLLLTTQLPTTTTVSTSCNTASKAQTTTSTSINVKLINSKNFTVSPKNPKIHK